MLTDIKTYKTFFSQFSLEDLPESLPNVPISRSKVLHVLDIFKDFDRVWVAGSAAIYPEKASDIDLWVLKKSTLTPDKLSEKWCESACVYQHLIEVTSRWQTDIEGHQVQLTFTGHANIFDLLEKFDLSCHAWARTATKFAAVHTSTLPGQPIKAINPGLTPEFTQQRLKKFTARHADTTTDMLWLPS